jgi:23S rRNA pseudouridine1911/1915/1917 synthase
MPTLPFDILYEDDQLIAINKPSGMLTLPDRHDEELLSLRGILEKHFGKIFIVHRLDKDTSGVIAFAKDDVTHKYMSKLFEGREIEKLYLGIVSGKPTEQSGTIDQPIAESTTRAGAMVINKRGKASVTDYTVLQNFRAYSLLQFHIHTGRTHQIRIHCKFMGHPIVCDPLYSDNKPILLSAIKKKFKLGKDVEEEKPLLARLALHAYRLSFSTAEGKALVLEAPLPKDMAATARQLEKNS